MSYQVTARKWRPQSFDQIVFQDHVSRTLRNSILNSRISHAFLFAGPRGVGKTTMARVLAKALNCLSFDGPTPDPCGTCDNCREIKEGTSFDVIEIDGASNRGIDDVRELRENVNFAPLKSRYKVYIIDEVHMLTKEAFNALLKTLEEPPPHVVFIFATTEMHQIPETILSRCQKFFFKKIPIDVMVKHLEFIVQREGYRISKSALYPMARAADGSMRDAQSLLDQVISFSAQKTGANDAEFEIAEDDALSILGIVSLESHVRQLNFILAGDAAGAVGEVEKISSMGVDIARYVAGFIDTVRIIRLIKNRAQIADILGFSAEEKNALENLAGSFDDEELSSIFSQASAMHTELRFSSNERINLEMALLDMISMHKSPSIAAIIKKLESGEGEKKNDAPPERVAASGPRKSEPSPVKPPASPETAGPEARPGIRQVWGDFLRSIQNDQQYLFSVLKSSIVSYESGMLSISFPDDGGIYYRMLDSARLSFIKEKLSSRLRKDLRVVLAGPGPAGTKSPVKNNKPSQAGAAMKRVENNPDEYSEVPLPEAEMLTADSVTALDKENPAVDKIKDVFLGEIIDKGDKNA
ncbi:MAG TPA: DNA polymerase III subunit gamma/tau [Spirochaetota bacterium]|mgnify:CR=1 FL=1|nr:DNA polymerase III subunit gamma/tau [Spirochaetota bacterium]